MWKSIKLGEILTFQRGFDITKKEQIDGPFPVISSSGITSYHRDFKVGGPGIITGRKGTLGKVYYIEGDYWPHDTTLWVKDFKGNDPKFLYYYLSTLHFEQFDAGASNPTLNRNHIHSLKVQFPERTEAQCRIASILSAYDELIENNNQRIKILEEMAEQLYKEWFVRMRFPGHESVRMVKGAPERWEVDKLSRFVDTQYGYTASAEEEEVGPKFLRITDIVPENLDWERVPHCKITDFILEKYLINDGDILVARTGATVGYAKLMHNPPKAVFASYLVRLIPKRADDKFIIGQLVESNDYKLFIQAVATGAAQPQANASLMTMFNVYIPPTELKSRYNQIVTPIFDEKNILLKKNQLLRRTRDLLLPRLMSGQLTVKEAEASL